MPRFARSLRSRFSLVFLALLAALNLLIALLSALEASWGAWLMLYGGSVLLNLAFFVPSALLARNLRRRGHETPAARVLFGLTLLFASLTELALAGIDLHGC